MHASRACVICHILPQAALNYLDAQIVAIRWLIYGKSQRTAYVTRLNRSMSQVDGREHSNRKLDWSSAVCLRYSSIAL